MGKRSALARKAVAVFAACTLALPLAGCGAADDYQVSGSSASSSTAASSATDAAPQIEGLAYESTVPVDYADQFSLYRYEGGYRLIDVRESGRFLVVPAGADVPENLPSDLVVLKQPISHAYLCATSAYALIDAIGASDAITLTGTNASGWYLDAPKDALASGSMAYAGKYSAPDYEALVKGSCDLALESTMLLHTPAVQETLEQLGIPVFIERSSYEKTPLGRAEWAKVYGALFGREDEADAFFAHEEALASEVSSYPSTGKSIVFFSISSDGSVTVRRPDDYLSQSIELAGASNPFSDLTGSGKAATVDMTKEQFYATAVNADILVYNGTIEGALGSVSDLVAKDPSFADFKAVKEGNVWTCDGRMFQATDQVAEMIADFHAIAADGDAAQTTFLSRVE